MNMEQRAWQPVPGNDEAHVYPIVDGATIFLSNAYIIRMPGLMVVVDPGDAVSQIETIRRVLDDLGNSDKPVLVLLTHCHVDHCFEFLSAPARLAPGRRLLVALQEEGIKALKLKDRELTGAGRFHKMIPDIDPDICLLSADAREFRSSECLRLGDGIVLSLTTETITTPYGNTVYVQNLSGSGFGIKAYYSPGHSPDSTVFQVGDLLFTGDALLAAEHFVAGLPGWNKNDSLATAQNLLWLVENKGISVVAPGHGSVLTSDQAVGKLQKMISRLTAMEIHKTFTVPAILASSEHAMDVAREARDIVAALADSLSQTAHYLSILDEKSEADRYDSAINRKRFDDVFAAFNEIATSMQSGRLLEMVLVTNCSMLFFKMGKLLRAAELEHIADRSLLIRLERMLDDFREDSACRPIRLQTEPELICIAINGDRLPAALLANSYQKRGLVRRLKWLGGRLVVDSRQDAPRLMVMVPAPMNRTDV
ncbi:MAG: MBL fold metallo-hydrolase [Nitrospiraceae bacterium]|jgi:glyoxylase-like metal-dependent hydrolase (beta-lactamase superfamily II)|nr:MBL fold metallo-hydrolase [Nitrospiraceae bacterium]